MEQLQEGISSPDVKKVQGLINAYFHASRVAENGEFDSNLTQAVKAFQSDNKARPTGIVDGGTMKLLQHPPTKTVYQIEYKGKTYAIEKADWAGFQKEFCKLLEPTVQAYENRAEEARSLWSAHSKVRKDTFFLFPVMVDAWGSATFPAESTISAGDAAAKAMRSALASGDAKGLAAAVKGGGAAVVKSITAVKEYRDNFYAGGEKLIQDLERVRDGCVLVLEVGAAIGTAGSSTAVTAGVMAGLGSYKELLNQVGKADSPKFNATDAFGQVVLMGAVEGTVSAVLRDKGTAARISKALAEKAGATVLKRFGTDVAAKMAEGAVKGGLSKALETSVKEVVKSLDPSEKMTAEKAATDIAAEVLKGAVAGAVFGGIDKQVGKFTSSYAKSLAGVKFKGLGEVDIKKALDKGAEKFVDQAVDRVGKEIVIAAASDPGKARNVEKDLADALAKDAALNAALAKLVKDKKLD